MKKQLGRHIISWDWDFGPYEEDEVALYDKYEENAAARVLEVVSQHQVVTDRELKVRLERDFFPWVTGRALNRLVDKDEIRLVHPPGRNGRMGTPENFFMDPSLKYEDVLGLLLRKRRISSYVNSLLTRTAPASFHAENVFESAFNSEGFQILGREASEFKDKKTKGIPGKELPNLDFILAKDKITYGVDIKNWIKYEFDSVPEVMDKVELAVELEITPFICARYVDKNTFFKIVEIPGIVYRYETLIVPPEFGSLAEAARTLLGYPIIAVDTLPPYKLDFMRKLHALAAKRLKDKK